LVIKGIYCSGFAVLSAGSVQRLCGWVHGFRE